MTVLHNDAGVRNHHPPILMANEEPSLKAAAPVYCVMLYHPLDTPPVALIRSLRDLQVSLVSTDSPFDALARLLLFARDLQPSADRGDPAASAPRSDPRWTEGSAGHGHDRPSPASARSGTSGEPRLILLIVRPRALARARDLVAAVVRYVPAARLWRYDETVTPHLAPLHLDADLPAGPLSPPSTFQ